LLRADIKAETVIFAVLLSSELVEEAKDGPVVQWIEYLLAGREVS
jgi:hypothetical protein